MSFAGPMRTFAAIAARVRAEVWPVTVAVPGGAQVAIAKSATKVNRRRDEQGAGWIQSAIATFNFPASGAFVPQIGNEWEITESETAAEVGTVWRCFDITDAAAGSEHRCVCFRKD